MDRDDILNSYKEAIVHAGLALKGKTMPYTSSNGHMFSQLNKENQIGIRLSKEDTSVFDAKYGALPFFSYGAKMREYVLVPEQMIVDKEELSSYLKKGFEFVNSKPTK